MYRFEPTRELVARSDDGQEYRVVEYTKFVNLADASTPHRWEPVGCKQYRVNGEEDAIMNAEGHLLIVGRNPRLLRVMSR